jgi:nicotinamide-nucleotide amidase
MTVENIKTPANVVTIARILLIPVFMVVLLAPWPQLANDPATRASLLTAQPWMGAFIFALLSATDSLDGYLARSRNEVTDFGKFLDPLADKILVAAALLALIEIGSLPSWIALLILAREFIVSGLRMVAATQGKVIAASWYGKLKTFTTDIAITLFVVKDAPNLIVSGFAPVTNIIAWIMMIAAVVLTVFSMVDYFVKSSEVLGIGTPSHEGK